MDHAAQRAMTLMVVHFLKDPQHQPKIEDDQKQDQRGFTAINKSYYLNGATET